MRRHRAEGYGLDLAALPKSKPEAERVGATYFYTGRPCAQGHLVARYTKGGNCSWCARANCAARDGREFTGHTSKILANTARAAANASGAKTYVPPKPCKNGHSLRWVASTNCVECNSDQQIKRKEIAKTTRIKKLYGLDAEAHEKLFQDQGRACAICRTEFEQRRLIHIDHCHDTGVVRGLLCQPCNQGIGLLRHNPTILIRAVGYING